VKDGGKGTFADAPDWLFSLLAGLTYSHFRESSVKVTGPSLVSPTFIMAPNLPSSKKTLSNDYDALQFMAKPFILSSE